MLKDKFIKQGSITMICVLAACLASTTPVLADGGTPPPASPPSTSSAGSVHLPAGTGLVVLNGSGHKLPLGSQQAAQAVVIGDPVWCPSTLSAPTPGAGGCSSAFSQFNGASDLIAYLAANPKTANGTIWIEPSYVGDLIHENGPITFDGSGLGTTANYALTFKGGWNGISGSSGITGSSTFSVPLSILKWNNNVSLSNIIVSGANGTGLDITTSRNISLKNVQATNNAANGATLDTTYNGGTGSLSINNSQFNGNTWYGAQVSLGTGGAATISGTHFDNNVNSDGLNLTSTGAITLTNVVADNNAAGGGAWIDNHNATFSQPVTINGTDNEFDSNHNNNLFIQSKGLVSLANVTASESLGGSGAEINNTFSTTQAGVILAGTNTFNTNTLKGLFIQSKGLITVNDLTSNDNLLSGADLENSATGASAGVTLTGMNVFNGNLDYGVTITSYGPIQANSIYAYTNGYSGASLDNCNYTGGSCSTPAAQPVSVTGSSWFVGNGQNGLLIFSNGLITANNITGISNQQFGASLDNSYSGVTAGVTLSGTNTFNHNIQNGLNLTTNGAAKLNSVTADNNGTSVLNYGAWINNSLGSASSGITLTGVNTFNGNYGTGLYLQSAGSVAASSIHASYTQQAGGVYINATGSVTLSGSNIFNANHGNGLEVHSGGAITTYNLTANENGSNATDAGVYLSNNSASTLAPVILNGLNTFNANSGFGLFVQSQGAITTNNLTANDNGLPFSNGEGADLINHYPNSTGGVTVAGVNSFNGNYSGGLFIQSNGAIAIHSITASNSAGGIGLSAENIDSTPASPQTISLTGTNVFNGNYNDGANLSAYGKITAANVTANWNNTGTGFAGLNLDNYYSDNTARPLAAIVLSGINTFNNNHGDGLDVTATGAISVSGVTANGSLTSSGVSLENDLFTGTPGITMTTLTASGNAYRGLWVRSHGTISGSSLTVNGNDTTQIGGFYGADIRTDGSSLTLSGTNTFQNNYDDNINAYALGAISINNLRATGSVIGNGAALYNGDSSHASAFSLTGSSLFQGNWLDGLYVLSYGAISGHNLTANGNGASGSNGFGIYLRNEVATSAQPVSLTGVNTFNGNYDGGLSIQTVGAISTYNLTANDNSHSTGAVLNVVSGPAKITINGINTFVGNYQSGLIALGQAAVTASNLNASSNGKATGGNGAILQAGTGTVTLTGVNIFNDNGKTGTGGIGLWLASASNVSLTSVTAGGNAGDGLSVSNTGNLTILCGSFFGNGNNGIDAAMSNTQTLTLTGVTASGNGTQNINVSGGPTILSVRDCPLP